MASEHDDRLAEDAQRASHPPAADQVAFSQHPAQPPQVDEGFAEGQQNKPDPPEEERVRDYAEGQEVVPHEEMGRFSEGQELDPDTPEKVVERRFSEGQEIAPDST